MRAREPDVDGYVERDGVKIGYEVFGDGPTTVVFVPIDAIVHSRAWKAQVPFLARTYRVVTIDPRGNGRSDRPSDPAAYGDLEYVADTLAVMDDLGIDRAVLVGICVSGWHALVCAALHPDRVVGVAAIAPWARDTTPRLAAKVDAVEHFDEERDDYPGWAMLNRNYWLRDWPGFADFFFHEICTEPHSTKLVEDMVGFACESTAETQLALEGAPVYPDSAEQGEALLSSVGCPVLVLHGTEDRCQPYQRGVNVARLTGGQLVTLEGSGHLPQGRDPVVVNLRLREFVDAVSPARPRLLTSPRTWTRGMARRCRVLYLSSPIGLGHARRDLAIARELRSARPDVTVEWLTQEPVLSFLERAGEQVHPASAYLTNESRHVEACAGEHDLHAFQAIREMDEILVANFMVFHDVATEGGYDLWVADESWDVDHFLHENPELKRAPFVWMTDFVGWMPMADGGAAEAALTADYNAEMVEHIARYPRLRDRSIFVGDPDDLVDLPLGPDLPTVRDWTTSHFDFAGYVTGRASRELDRDALRRRFRYGADETVCVVSVGGSGVGEHLLRSVVAAFPAARRRIPDLRMVVVTGPRISSAALAEHAGTADGLEIHGFLPDLDLRHAACDIAVVQGGLTTTMELAVAGRPFLYVPLAHHFEQQIHVRHRLERYRAGRCMDYRDVDPDALAEALVEELSRPSRNIEVGSGGAANAARMLAELL
jgi:pimeloyl-ACP methyl ester carboxylesterase/predicted glycosyltransferase